MHKSKIPQITYLRDLRVLSVAGAEGFEPSARGFGVENICSIIFSQPLENADFTGVLRTDLLLLDV